MHLPNLGAPITREPQPGGTTSLTFLFITHTVSTRTGHPVPLAPCRAGKKASSCRPQARVAKAVVRRWRGKRFPQFLRPHRATQAGWVEVACEADSHPPK